MDTCALFVKMCETAKELQDNHEWDYGDYYYYNTRVPGAPIFHFFLGDPETPIIPDKSYYTWLPRQDELQMMFKEPAINLLNRFHSWCNSDYAIFPYTPVAHFTSMEQLWLGFVMEELYQNVWDGGDWLFKEV